jgi:ferrochelatase
MSARGVRRAIGVLAAAQRTYSGCLQYKENVRDARAGLTAAGAPDIDVVYVGDWYQHPGFIEANADHVRQAYARLPEHVRDRARLIFTAHSIPTSMAAQYPYEHQLRRSAELIAGAVLADSRDPRDPPADPRRWTLVYQSRSGRPGDPWLEPDVCDYLRAERDKGLDAVVLCPVGFLCDHVEVLYDLDVEAAEACRQAGIVMARAPAVNLHPRFIDALADAVADVWRRYEGNRPIPVGTFRPSSRP